MPEQAAGFDETPVSHDRARFGAHHVGDETQHRRGDIQGGARRGDPQNGVAGANPVHHSDGKSRHMKHPQFPIVNETTKTALRGQEFAGGDSFGKIPDQNFQVHIELPGVQPHFHFANRDIVRTAIFRDGVEAPVAGVGLRVHSQELRFFTSQPLSPAGD